MKRAKPTVQYAWALWVPRYNTYVPVTKGIGPDLQIYNTRALARRAQLKNHDYPVRIRIEPLPPPCGCGLIDDVGVVCRKHLRKTRARS